MVALWSITTQEVLASFHRLTPNDAYRRHN